MILDIKYNVRHKTSKRWPLIKVIRLGRQSGQQGFKGQAIFFAQQVEEVSEQLPIPIACADITILAESLQNMSSRRTYVVDAGKIKKALEYLKVNNQLYAIVQCNYDLSNNEINDIILKSVTTEQWESITQIEQSYFKYIGNEKFILRRNSNKVVIALG